MIREKGNAHVDAWHSSYDYMRTAMLPMWKFTTLIYFQIKNGHYELREPSKTQNGVHGPEQ